MSMTHTEAQVIFIGFRNELHRFLSDTVLVFGHSVIGHYASMPEAEEALIRHKNEPNLQILVDYDRLSLMKKDFLSDIRALVTANTPVIALSYLRHKERGITFVQYGGPLMSNIEKALTGKKQ